MNEREVTIKVYPDCGNCYYVTLVIDDRFDAEEQVDVWMDYNLINGQDWEWA